MRRAWVFPMIVMLSIGMAQAGAQPKPATATAAQQVLMPGSSPLVSFDLVFLTGSAADPKGKEGLASLTARMVSEGGSRGLTFAQIQDAMYPMATDFSSQVDKEMTAFTGTTHLDNLEKYYGLIRGMLLEPGFREDDFQRVKTDQINYLKVTLRANNDEELGKEVLYTMIYPPSHPYGHTNAGALGALEKLTLDDVRSFYREHYTQANLVIGLAGGYPGEFAERMSRDFQQLPAGRRETTAAAAAAQKPGTEIEIVQRETRSTAISLGFPIPVTRADKDWPALAVVASYLGQHRSSNSHLYQQLREARGLNYGDYAYIEYFPQGMYRFEPSPNLGRRSQIFQIWIRPVEPQNGQFALRAALYEYDKLAREGMSEEAFASTREFLSKYVNILTQTQFARLGYQVDSRYYGIGDFPGYMKERLRQMTREQVNQAIRQYLRPGSMRVAIVTKDAAGLRQAIVDNARSPMSYVSPKPAGILEEDKIIQDYPIKAGVKVVAVEEVFQ